MKKLYLSILQIILQKSLLILLLTCTIGLSARGQAVYVDSNIGNDANEGTALSPFYSIEKAFEALKSMDNEIHAMKINPGIYVLDNVLEVATEKKLSDKRIIIEAAVLPDDTSWSPEKMPVIISRAKKENIDFFAAFLINESHVTIRGIKFHGYVYPNTKYFSIARINKEKTDLLVEQCMFVGDEQASVIQVGILVHGDLVKVNHCIFHNVRNAIVFWEDSGSGYKTGNSMTNCIVNGVAEGAVWTCTPDKDFLFENNIISNAKCVWVINTGNQCKYYMNNCVTVNYQIFKGNWENKIDDFNLEETNVLKEGEIQQQLLLGMDNGLPINYLHIIPGTLGDNIGAGLFKFPKR